MLKESIKNLKRVQIFQLARRYKWPLIGGSILFFLLKVLWWDGVQFIGPIPPTGQPKIVFLSCRVGAIWGEIYSMNLDGSEKTLLLSYPINRVNTRGNVHLEHPVIRPDRKQIAYYMRQNYSQSIWTMNMDGSGNRRITPWAYVTSNPSYTADGRNILFGYLYPSMTDTPSEVYSMNTKGKRWHHIGRYMDNNSRMEIQKISDPQGPWIGADSTGDWFRPVARRTKITHADGKTFPLPKLAQEGFGFSLNPTRSQFVFCASSSPLTAQIYLMNTNGTGLVRLTSDKTSKRNPRFTPDGQQIVFISGDDRRTKDENADIYIMNADGTNQHALTQTPQNEEWFDVK